MKVCKILWRRALGLSLLGLLFLMTLALLSATTDSVLRDSQEREPEEQSPLVLAQQAVQDFVGSRIRSFYADKAPFRSIKVAREEYARTMERFPSEVRDYDADNDIVASDSATVGDYFPEEEDALGINPEFQEGDFDYDNATAEAATALEVPTSLAATPIVQTDRRGGSIPEATQTVRSPFREVTIRASRPLVTLRAQGSNASVVEDGLFWSQRIEQLLPRGVSEADVSSFLTRTRNQKVRSVEPPTWNRCGRPKNQYVVLEDGTRACARYRAPHHYLVQGEVMSFYLSRLMGIENVPAVSLSPVSRWRSWTALNESLNAAGWTDNATVALIQWVDGLERDKMPWILLEALENGRTLSPSSFQLQTLSDAQLLELAQWSDLVVFDYITGNYDRVASMQDAADREQRPAILQETIHNLVKSHQSQALWLIDNESGLLDSYSLLYGPGSLEVNQKESRFVKFHKDMLSTLCVFRRGTFMHVQWLKSFKSRVAKYLVDFIKKHEPHFKRLPSVFNNREFVMNFHKRIDEVYQHMKHCHVF